jgi:hypothetical protein
MKTVPERSPDFVSAANYKGIKSRKSLNRLGEDHGEVWYGWGNLSTPARFAVLWVAAIIGFFLGVLLGKFF